MVNRLFFTLLLLVVATASHAQSGAFGYSQLSDEQLRLTTTFCLPNQEVYKTAIRKNKWNTVRENPSWIYFSATAIEVSEAYKNGELPDYYIEYAPPHLLNDSMRAHHNIDAVHNGTGLSMPYKGKDVIVGYVDTGIEIQHPDFKDANGKTRILRIWDHSVSSGGTLSPYGYGIIWDSTQINAGLCTSTDDSAHGSTVAGAGSGNGRAVGYNQGAAPESDIIMVKTNFSLPNWSLTVADACDYIFKVADTLGKRAIVNLSVGSYLGSHDGRDPAAVRINNLLDEKAGRIVVAACGNSGGIGNYHCQGIVTNDTTFTWFENNPNSSFGPNKIFFDLYSDMDQATYSYSFKAVNPAANYQTRAQLVFRPATASLGVPVFDTLRNANGDRIATLEIYTSQEGANFHMQVLFRNVDTTNYLYGFYTRGSGKYDLWSGTGLGYNKIVEVLPSSAAFPSIVNYHLPDAQQTIVSNWNCSPKVVSVGNTRNRSRFANYAGGYYYPNETTPVGKLSPGSSKGPNRHNVIKPDVAASGDVMLSAGPLWYFAEPANYPKMDSGGWHLGNGGTSMSSPVVAGIAALFLERCEKGNYQTFLDALQQYSFSNTYTGPLPNNAYGYGLIDAAAILQNQEFSATIDGDTVLCVGPNLIEVQATDSIASVLWSNGSTTLVNQQYTPGEVFAIVYNEFGCGVHSDTLILTQETVESIDPITVSGDYLTLSTTSSNAVYQWTLNGADLPGETNNSLILSSFQSGFYDCYTTGENGCTVYAGGVGIYLSVENLSNLSLIIYPNPATNQVTISTESNLISVKMFDLTGKEIPVDMNTNVLNIQHLADGYYHLLIQTDKGSAQSKLIKRSE